MNIHCLKVLTATALAIHLVGCASTSESVSGGSGGNYVKNPHLEKVWLAEGFDFNGYDTLYIADTLVDPGVKPHEDEVQPLEIAKCSLRDDLAKAITDKKIFQSVVMRESEIKPGAKALKLENLIIEYTKGGGGARYWVGLYGGGQPVIKVHGKTTDAAREVFSFEGRRSGVSAGARMLGAFKTDVDIQHEDIQSLIKDLTDFIEQTAKHQTKK